MKTKTLPSDFTNKPFASVLRKSELESIARSIMIILSETGNTWRHLSFEEYKKEIKKATKKTVDDWDKRYFDQVVQYCTSPNAASRFSEAWAIPPTFEINKVAMKAVKDPMKWWDKLSDKTKTAMMEKYVPEKTGKYGNAGCTSVADVYNIWQKVTGYLKHGCLNDEDSRELSHMTEKFFDECYAKQFKS